MEQFFQATAIVLMSMVLILTLKNQDRGIGQLLSILICAMVLMLAIRSFAPILDFVRSIQGMIDLNPSFIKQLVKCVGIAITAEIAELLCQDSGNGAMGKALQLFSTAMISYLCIPMLTQLLDLVQEVLSNL